MYEVFLEKSLVPGGGPDQLNSCKEAGAGSLLTCRSDSASFPSTIQWGFYHHEAALESRSGKIATGTKGVK